MFSGVKFDIGTSSERRSHSRSVGAWHDRAWEDDSCSITEFFGDQICLNEDQPRYALYL